MDGRPSFYLTGKNRSLFLADYALENLQHRELAYLKALQAQVFNPATGYTSTQTYYSMTFSQTGNYCEIHEFSSLSFFKSLAKTIAAARLVENDAITRQAEEKFVVMNGGTFLRDPDGPGRRYDDGVDYEGRGSDRRRRDDRYNDRRDDRYNDRGDDRYDDRNRRDNQDDRYDSRRDDRGRNDDRYNNDRDRDSRDGNRSSDGPDGPPMPPVKISINKEKIYDNDELIGTYKQTAGTTRSDMIITIYDQDNRKAATVKRTPATSKNWQITLADGTQTTAVYSADSPLVRLFTFLAEKGYL